MARAARCWLVVLWLAGCGQTDPLRGSTAGDAGRADARFDGDRGEDGDAASGMGGGSVADAGQGALPDDELNAPLTGALPAEPTFSAPASGYEDPEGDRSGEGEVADPRACHDEHDNDGQHGADCDDPSCQRLRSCCVGNGDCCGPAGLPPLPEHIDFTGPACADAGDPVDAAACLGSSGVTAQAFGEPASWVLDGAFAPGGDAEFDSGVLVGSPVDLAVHRLELGVRFAGADGCGTTCLEGAGIGLTSQDGLGTSSHVRPEVALLASGSRSEVALVVADEVVERWPLGAEDVEWALVVRPTGGVAVRRGDTTVADQVPFVPVRAARLVLYGRNRDPAAVSSGVRVLDLTAQVELCDIPSAWSGRQPLGLGDTSVAGLVGSPSIARDGAGRELIAFEQKPSDGASIIRLGEREAADRTSVRLLDTEVEPALRGSQDHDAGGVHEPELLHNPATGEWVLFYTAVREGPDGPVRSVGRAVLEAGEGFVADAAPVLADLGDAVEAAAPTIARRADGEWAIVAQVRTRLDGWQLRVFRSNDVDGGRTWTALESDLPVVSSLEAQLPVDFRADEIGSPSLVVHNGAWQLYYARRRGTRWSIGLIASHELLYWLHLEEGRPVLDAGAAVFDRLGVTAPDVLPDGDAVEVVYVGLDGVAPTLGRAARDATSVGRFPSP